MAKRRDWNRQTLAAGVRSGDTRALARAITLVENGDALAYDLVRDIYPDTGRAYALGVTGPPGVGKSSLISALVRHVRAEKRSVGVISVDPSSPFTHGALLGDRIRLADHFLDPGVFIRSMGTRGHLGGLAEATLQAALLLDAAGKDLLFLETVGAGQSRCCREERARARYRDETRGRRCLRARPSHLRAFPVPSARRRGTPRRVRKSEHSAPRPGQARAPPEPRLPLRQGRLAIPTPAGETPSLRRTRGSIHACAPR